MGILSKLIDWWGLRPGNLFLQLSSNPVHYEPGAIRSTSDTIRCYALRKPYLGVYSLSGLRELRDSCWSCLLIRQ